jgi:hypothetical protein
MDAFRSEQTLVERKINGVLTQLEEVGMHGSRIADELHTLKNVVKYPKDEGHNFIGSDRPGCDVTNTFDKVRNELDLYAEKFAILIGDITEVVTQVRYLLSQVI